MPYEGKFVNLEEQEICSKQLILKGFLLLHHRIGKLIAFSENPCRSITYESDFFLFLHPFRVLSRCRHCIQKIKQLLEVTSDHPWSLAPLAIRGSPLCG